MTRRLAAALLALLPPALALAEDPAPKPWKNAGELSFANASGNSKSTTLGVGDVFTYSWTQAALELSGRVLSVESEGARIAEQWQAAEKASWKWSDRDYFFERVGWDRNVFAGYDGRWDLSLGVGRELVKTEKDLLAGELGGGYTSESRLAPPDSDFGSGRAFARYERKLSDTAAFSQDAEYLHNFEDPKAFRLNTLTSATASMTTHVSLRFSFSWKHVQRPPAGFRKDDTLTSAALIVNY